MADRCFFAAPGTVGSSLRQHHTELERRIFFTDSCGTHATAVYDHRRCRAAFSRCARDHLSVVLTVVTESALTEVPEHLLQRSRDRRRAMGMSVDDDGGAAPADTGAVVPAAAAAAAPAMKAPVPFPAAAAPPPIEPPSEWVQAATGRQKIPYWVMPVLLFLPIWLVLYVGTLEEPTREEGVLYEGSVVYEENCASCHGATGGGGVGPAFSNGAIIETFPVAEDQMAWIAQGTDGWQDLGRSSYGANETAYKSSAKMPAFGDELTTEEIIAVTFYERVTLGGYDVDEAFAEIAWDLVEHDELEDLPEHWAEGANGVDEAQVVAQLAHARDELNDTGSADAEAAIGE